MPLILGGVGDFEGRAFFLSDCTMAIASTIAMNVRINPAVTAAADELSRATEAAQNDPRYAETVHRFGPERAHWLAVHYGAQALSASFQRHTPIEMDSSKQAIAHLDVFNWAAGQMPGKNAAEVQARADSIWNKLTAMEKANLAESPGSSSTIISDALKAICTNSAKAPTPEPILPTLRQKAGTLCTGAGLRSARIGRLASPAATERPMPTAGPTPVLIRVFGRRRAASTSSHPCFGGTEFAKAGPEPKRDAGPRLQIRLRQRPDHPCRSRCQALGLNPKDLPTAKDFATLDKDDPTGRKQRNGATSYSTWLKEHKDEIDKRQDAIDHASDDETRQRLIGERNEFIRNGQHQTGISAVDDRLKDKPEAREAHERNKRRIEELRGVHHGARLDMGDDAARNLTAEQRSQLRPASPEFSLVAFRV